MDVESITLRRLKMPLKNAFETSFSRMEFKDFILVSASDGHYTGYGESVSLPDPVYNEETSNTVWHILEDYLIPMAFEKGFNHPDEVSKRFQPIRRNNMAKASLEGAIWDLYAKQQGISLASALGGAKDTIDVGVSLGIEPTVEQVLQKVERFLEEGYKKIKVKIKPGFDYEPLLAIRKRFGKDLPLMADANSAYSLDHLNILKKLDELNLMMIEQPLAHDDIIDHQKLQKELETPICLDESIHTVEDARKAIELGSCEIINIKIGRVGGLTEAKKIHDLCQEHGVPVWCGGMLEAGVGRAHNIAITTLSNFVIPGDTSASSNYWEQDIVRPEIELSEPGTINVPEQAGIGYELNEEVVQKYMTVEKSFQANPTSKGAF